MCFSVCIMSQRTDEETREVVDRAADELGRIVFLHLLKKHSVGTHKQKNNYG